jgi:hypothetical protein
MKKYSKQAPDEPRLVALSELKLFNATPTLLPMVPRVGQPFVMQSAQVPRSFKDFVPSESTVDGHPTLLCESLHYFIDTDTAGNVWIAQYDMIESHQLINITKDSGIFAGDSF